MLALATLAASVILCSNSGLRLKRLRLKIPASHAPAALAEFIRQTDLQVLFEFDAIYPFVTREIDGEYYAEDALRRMFDGRGLTYEFVNDRTVAILPLPAALPRTEL